VEDSGREVALSALQFEAFGCLWRIKISPYAYADENFSYCAVALFFDGSES
jgi:hypothetical protein